MPELFRISDVNATSMEPKRMSDLGFSEPVHLESWLTSFPGALGSDLMIVATQFNVWQSARGQASERPDILALSTSGELAVIELKRGGDRQVHLQTITYGALAATFTLETLASAHAAWLKQRDESITPEEAASRLKSHVDGEWDDKVLELPRLVMVAESFPPQVLTSVHWLSQVAPNLSFECHQYSLFEGHENGERFVTFERIFPISDFSDQMLVAAEREVRDTKDLIAGKRRRAKSVTIIHEQSLIPEGARLTLELDTLARKEVIDAVEKWLEADPIRKEITWVSDPAKPLLWAAAEDPEVGWTPSALRNQIFTDAGVDIPSFSAADAWSYGGKNLYWIADEAPVG